MEKIRLNNGVEMPLVGYGVFQIAPQETVKCVEEALAAGYRSIDTAQAYQNEEAVGKGVKRSGVNRDEIFLTTKVWISNAGEEKATKSIDESLHKLGTDYIDLLLIHQHYGDYYGTWRAMEKALKEGKVRAIGVSNFDIARFTDLALFNEIAPAVNQLQANVYMQQRAQSEFLKSYNTKIMAWGPIAQGSKDLLSSPTLVEIAANHHKTITQVALRWLVQRDIIVIPKSTHRERMEENIEIFDFQLTKEEMEKIGTLNQHDTGTVAFDAPQFIKWLASAYK